MLEIKPSHLLVLFVFAFLVRLLFTFYLQYFLYWELIFTNNDSWSFTEAFINLYHYGSYTFDPTHPDASFFRPPVYPIFWGIHYIIFGVDYVYEAVAISQCFIDSISTMIVYFLAKQLGAKSSFSIIPAILFSINPFQIIWVPITGTEIIATFMSLLIIHIILIIKFSRRNLIIIGLLIGFSVLSRQYLGIFLAIAFIWVLISKKFNTKEAITAATLITFGFLVILTPWVMRNLVYHGKPYVLMGETRGYYNYGPDAIAFERLFNKFDENITTFLYDTIDNGTVNLEGVRLSPDTKALIQKSVLLAHQCGPSFISGRGDRSFTFLDRDMECEQKLITMFDEARNRFKKEVGFFKYNMTRVDALKKAFFKNTISDLDPTNIYISYIIKFCFTIRTIILFISFSSIFFANRQVICAIIFPLFMYFYITVFTIHTEIRYLIQADAILLAIFAFSLNGLWRWFGPRVQ